MRIKAIPIELPEDNPFKNDKLNRGQAVQTICQILSSLDEPLVLAITSPWGTGKTTFLRLLNIKLKEMGMLTLYLNAWENDFTDNALVSLIGELSSLFKSLRGGQHSDSELLSKIKKAAISVLKIGIPFAAKIATSGAINLPANIGDNLSDLFQKIAEDQIDTYEKAKNDILEFKSQLKKLRSKIVKDQENKKPIVLLIDEMDRCRPNYALELLEAAKHLFDVPGYAFVLAIDKHQVSESIKAIYGSGMVVEEYLRRFFDLQYNLPLPDIKEYCDSLFQRFDCESYFEERKAKIPSFRSDRQEFLAVSVFLFSLYHLNLRAIEQCFTQLSLVLRSTPTDKALYPTLAMFLIIIRSVDYQLYDKILTKSISQKEVLKQIRSHPNYLLSKQIEFNLDYLEALLALSFYDGHADSEYQKALQTSENKDDRSHFERILKILQHIEYNFGPWDILNYVKRRIEYTDPFIF